MKKLTVGFGIFLIGIAAALLMTMPSKADVSPGFKTPIIAFEFARNERDLAFLSGDNKSAQLNRSRMDKGHMWDMIFPFAYNGFLLCLLIGLLLGGYRVAWFGIPFALMAIPFDIMENLTLLSITHELGKGVTAIELLPRLYIETWLKWGAIGVSIGVIAIGSFFKREYLSGALGCGVAFMTGLCFLSNAKPEYTELMSLSVSVFFLWHVIKSIKELKS